MHAHMFLALFFSRLRFRNPFRRLHLVRMTFCTFIRTTLSTCLLALHDLPKSEDGVIIGDVRFVSCEPLEAANE